MTYKPPGMPKMPNFDFPIPRLPAVPSFAESAKEALMNSINHFQSRLGPDEEMGMHISGSLAYRVTGIGYSGPMIMFYGVDHEGREVLTCQHHSQINLTLMAIPKPDEVEQARRVGFDTGPREAGAEG